MIVLLALGIVNEYLSSLVKCLHQIGECMIVLLAMGIVNEYLSSLVKYLHPGIFFNYSKNEYIT